MALDPKTMCELARRIADELAPGLVAQGLTLCLVLGNVEHGWAQAIRGDRPVAVVALQGAADDVLEPEGWGSAEVAGA